MKFDESNNGGPSGASHSRLKLGGRVEHARAVEYTQRWRGRKKRRRRALAAALGAAVDLRGFFKRF